MKKIFLSAALSCPLIFAQANERSLLTELRMNATNNIVLINLAEQQTINQRFGDIHYNPDEKLTGNVWIKTSLGKLDIIKKYKHRPYSMDYNIYMLGADIRSRFLENSTLVLGGYISHSIGDPKYRTQGDGKIKNETLGLYATLVTDNHFYVDAVIKVNHTNNKYNTVNTHNERIKLRNKNTGYAGSLEIGKMFVLGSNIESHLYLEPQAQVSYYFKNSENFTASNGFTITSKKYHTTVSRLSLGMGYRYQDESNTMNFYIKPGYTHEFEAWQAQLGATINIKNNHNLYTELDYTKSNRYKDKKVTLGYRFTF